MRIAFLTGLIVCQGASSSLYPFRTLYLRGGSSVGLDRNHSTKVLAPPVIDISALLKDDPDSEERSCVVKAIGDACRQWGFFQVTNHGLPAETQSSFAEAMRRFFHMPLHQKLRVRRTERNSRGFANDELTKQLKDRKELFDVGHVPCRSLPHDHELNQVMDGHNQWPSDKMEEQIGGFQDPVMRYYDACVVLSRVLMSAIAESLRLPRDFFGAGEDRADLGRETSAGGGGYGAPVRMEPHTSYLRLNYYPVIGGQHGEGGGFGPLGVSRHTDAGALTVLLQDDVAGLEVYSGSKEANGDGEWVEVTPVRGAFTINIGDMLQVWTNDLYCAPEHRVRASEPDDIDSPGCGGARRKRGERFSAPFFYNPSYAAVVEPIPELTSRAQSPSGTEPSPAPAPAAPCIDAPEAVKAEDAAVAAPSMAPKYRPISWGDFRARRFAGDFADKGREVQIEDFLTSGR